MDELLEDYADADTCTSHAAETTRRIIANIAAKYPNIPYTDLLGATVNGNGNLRSFLVRLVSSELGVSVDEAKGIVRLAIWQDRNPPA